MFVVEEESDLVYRRDGNGLIAKVDIPLAEHSQVPWVREEVG